MKSNFFFFFLNEPKEIFLCAANHSEIYTRRLFNPNQMYFLKKSVLNRKMKKKWCKNLPFTNNLYSNLPRSCTEFILHAPSPKAPSSGVLQCPDTHTHKHIYLLNNYALDGNVLLLTKHSNICFALCNHNSSPETPPRRLNVNV